MQMRRTRFLPKAMAVELRRLPWRVAGLSIFGLAAACWLALISWSFADPGPNYATLMQPRNWLGYRGASIAGFLMEGFGLASPLLILPVAALGLQIATGYPPLRPRLRMACGIAALLALPAFFSCFQTPSRWLPGTGLGGIAGDTIAARIDGLSAAVPSLMLWPCSALLFFIAGFWLLWRACGLKVRDLSLAFKGAGANLESAGVFDEPFHMPLNGERRANRVTSWTKYFSPRNRALVPSEPREFWMTGVRAKPSQPARKSGTKATPAAEDSGHAAPSRFASWKGLSPLAAAASGLSTLQNDSGLEDEFPEGETDREENLFDDVRIEPFFGPRRHGRAETGGQGNGPGRETPSSGFRRLTGRTARAANGAQRFFDSVAGAARGRAPLIYVKKKPAAEDCDDDFVNAEGAHALPPLSLLAPAPQSPHKRNAADPALMERAAALMRVLGDFGVKGRISGIYPGPVITLFELEPARGTKPSRVIGLADDIARSMSAVSARITAFPGRDAIGIELPNPKRETVSLRAVLESPVFQNSQAVLPLALGKSIGGEPITADLARMPHLLIAGTAGTGKSAGISAMILSLLFRLPPGQCNFILIDSKMLELSVYSGIPHLIAPVVADPKKAVAALKWAVKEMHERYERMNQLGVRSIVDYNAKAATAQLRGLPIRRAIQTGFDPRTGLPVEEEEIVDPVSMPYLIIVIDEIADLMMAAGKDVEFAVQRLSQMARAAGIHLIVATERPGAVTGTVKANFPSRISFQAASKIESRTVIGEQGAEQLLGAGDMLYMASGGRIVRAHGPFVSHGEVEAVADYLKAQGAPSYREGILEDGGGFEDGAFCRNDGDGRRDLYGQAVEIVLKDRKPTTSYLQQRLGIAYNKAASLIERMEQEGIIGAPGRTGRREILLDTRL
jgi:DNA segregation ATPase FtsK/SpoIIIE, S-DNA-T family